MKCKYFGTINKKTCFICSLVLF